MNSGEDLVSVVEERFARTQRMHQAEARDPISDAADSGHTGFEQEHLPMMIS